MITLNSPTLLLALLLAVLATWLAYRMGARSTQPRIAALEGKCETLSAQIDAHAQMDQTLKPLQHAMSTLADQVESAERARVSAISGLSEQVLGVGREVRVRCQCFNAASVAMRAMTSPYSRGTSAGMP